MCPFLEKNIKNNRNLEQSKICSLFEFLSIDNKTNTEKDDMFFRINLK